MSDTAELRAVYKRNHELEAEKEVMHQNMLTVVGASVAIKAELKALREAAQAVVDARETLAIGDCRVNEYTELVIADQDAHKRLAALTKEES